MASIQVQADTWESYSKSAKVGLGASCMLTGIACTLNLPVNRLM